MTFGEKLFKLRKEKGFSQEALAEKLNTTRQAVSKWENDQGYPEAEKILTLANIFGVSTDYLLKSGEEEVSVSEKNGYYVSKEKAESWLAYEKRTSGMIGTGVGFFILARIPFLMLSESNPLSWIIGMVLVTVGIGSILVVCLNDRDYEYKVLKRNILMFDNAYITELRERYALQKKKYIRMIIISIAVIIVGAAGVVFEGDTIFLQIYNVIYAFMAAFSIAVLIYGFSVMDAYELLAENEKHTNSFFFKLIKRMK